MTSLTFAAGIRGCIGWRFAYVHHLRARPMPLLIVPYSIYEIQAFLVELISSFEFAPTDDLKRLRRELCGVMAPTLEGDTRSVSMPLRVSLLDNDA